MKLGLVPTSDFGCFRNGRRCETIVARKGKASLATTRRKKAQMICRFRFLLTRYEEMLEQGSGRMPAKRDAASGNMYEH
jgi:hypothetical protein